MYSDTVFGLTEFPVVCISPEDLNPPSVKAGEVDLDAPRPVITNYLEHIQQNTLEVNGEPNLTLDNLYPEFEDQTWRIQLVNDKSTITEFPLKKFPFNFKTGFPTILDFYTAMDGSEADIDKLVPNVYNSMGFGKPLTFVTNSIYAKYKNPEVVDMKGIIHCLVAEGFVRIDGQVSTRSTWLLFNDINLPYMIVELRGGAVDETNPFCIISTSEEIAEKLLSYIIPQLIPVEIPLVVHQLSGYRDGHYGVNGVFEAVSLKKDMDYAMEEFYPWIKMGLKEYFEEYFKSRANVLVLIGPPGTGKSTLIRTAIRDLKIRSMLVYKSSVMQDDSFVKICQDFLSSNDKKKRRNAVIVEDGDMIMGKREDGNTQMAEILNATNGICSDSNSKFILSTNLDSVRNIDPALLRPGRCYDILCFRHLTAAEAEVVRSIKCLPYVEFNPKEKYTLAEVLNDGVSHSQVEPIVQPRFGFQAS